MKTFYQQLLRELIQELGMLPVVFIHVVVALIAFLVIDCAAGQSGTQTATVIDKHYVPEASWYTSEWKRVQTGSEKHPVYRYKHYYQYHHRLASYTLLLATWDGNTSLQVSSGTYQVTQIHQQLPIRIRRGRWTHLPYWTTLEY